MSDYNWTVKGTYTNLLINSGALKIIEKSNLNATAELQPLMIQGNKTNANVYKGKLVVELNP